MFQKEKKAVYISVRNNKCRLFIRNLSYFIHIINHIFLDARMPERCQESYKNLTIFLKVTFKGYRSISLERVKRVPCRML